MMFSLIFFLLYAISRAYSLKNGLALTPPMGWLHWERFRCVTDCVKFPDYCISEKLFMRMADRMAEDGFLEAGYEYIIMDDCWLATERDSNGRLQPNAERFPSGIKALADYIHDKGLKFGLYEDYGNKTCGGYPGSLGYLELDANTFAEWGVDYLKLDGCNVTPDENMELGHLEMASYLNKTGRPIVFSCEIPLYRGIFTNYTRVAEACNLWRSFRDIDDSWESVRNIISLYKIAQNTLQPLGGPGQWNDPDMLIIGNFGLSYEQAKVQMTVWSILASPLLMSVDLRTIKPEFKDILLNKHAIAINQDPLGSQGRLLLTIDDIDIWRKQLSPNADGHARYALGFVSNRHDGYPYTLSFTLRAVLLVNPNGYNLIDVFNNGTDVVTRDQSLEVKVAPSGAEMWLLSPLLDSEQ